MGSEMCIRDRYAECENKGYSPTGDYQLGDGTWCREGKRNTRCPTSAGNVLLAADQYFTSEIGLLLF